MRPYLFIFCPSLALNLLVPLFLCMPSVHSLSLLSLPIPQNLPRACGGPGGMYCEGCEGFGGCSVGMDGALGNHCCKKGMPPYAKPPRPTKPPLMAATETGYPAPMPPLCMYPAGPPRPRWPIGPKPLPLARAAGVGSETSSGDEERPLLLDRLLPLLYACSRQFSSSSSPSLAVLGSFSPCSGGVVGTSA